MTQPHPAAQRPASAQAEATTAATTPAATTPAATSGTSSPGADHARVSLLGTGGWRFMTAAAIGRLPASTLQLGLLMVVTGSGLGFTLGGLTVAAVGIGSAIGAPILGRLVDRRGPLPVVAGALLVQTIALLLVLALVSTRALPGPTVLAFAMLVGMANPQVGPIARARWSHLAREHRSPDLISQAMGYEGAVDETSFVVGPVLAGLLVGLLGPVPALWCLLAFTWLGEGVFLVYLWRHRADWARTTPTDTQSPAVAMPWGAMIWPLLAVLSVGTLFGATQTSLTAINDLRGTPQFTGLVYGSMGIGSAVVSLLVVRLRSVPLGVRISAGAAIGLVMTIVLSQLQTPLPSALVAITVGAGVGAVLVSGISRVEQVAPSAIITQAMTFASTCITLGVSLGAAVAGQLVSVPSRGFVPAMIACAVAVVAGLVVLRSPHRGRSLIDQTGHRP